MFLRLCVAGGVIAGCRNQANNAISPNTIENNKQNIIALLLKSYEAGEMPLDKAITTINSLYAEIARMIDFKAKDEKNIQEELIEYFLSQKYVLAIAPMRLRSSKFCINALCSKIEPHKNFDLSNLPFTRFPNLNNSIPVFKVTETIVPDVRETDSRPNEERMFIDGLTLLGKEASKDIVLIFPEKIRFMAEREGIDENAYMESVIVNEVSQAYFRLLFKGHSLDEELPPIEGVDTSNLTLYHALEAFSDMASLKYGIFSHEIMRVISSTSDEYAFSRMIAIARIRKTLAKLRIDQQNREINIEKIIKDNETDFKASILDAYEVVLSYIYHSKMNEIRM